MDHRYRKFLAVAETGSFSEAALKLHVTQPAITIAVASLERSLGKKLYLRKKYTVEITNDGRIVAEAAKKIALETQKMRINLGLEKVGERFQLGIIDSLAHLLYASPEKSNLLGGVEVRVDNSRQIIQELAANTIDAGLITGQPKSLGSDITIAKLRNEEFVLAAAPEVARVCDAEHIDNWLAFNQDSTSFRYFSKQFRKSGVSVTAIFYSTSMELLKEMAIAGKGVALLPRHFIKQSVANGTLEIIELPRPLGRPIWAIMRKDSQPGIISQLTANLDVLLADGNAVTA